MKLRVREETKVPIAEQRLYWEGTLLDSNEKTLSDYDNPRNGKVLYMITRTGDQEEDSKKMMLHIRDSMSCRIFTLDFRREDKFVDVEQKIKDVEGLATWRQLKLADGRSSLDYCGSSPFECGLRDGDTIYLDRGFAQPMLSKLNTMTNPKPERNTQGSMRSTQ
jgi:ubiquitin domain-containing protein